MLQNRAAIVARHNVVNREFDYFSPLSVGNGELAYTVDMTGVQTLYRDYETVMPLCTMSNFGWHTEPDQGTYYSREDLTLDRYPYRNREVSYAVRSRAGEEAVYHWLRINPHRINLFRLGLLYQGQEIKKEQITDIHQELDLYNGIISSEYRIEQIACRAETVCDSEDNMIGISLASLLLKDEDLTLVLEFPYGSEEISGGRWDRDELHKTALSDYGSGVYGIIHELDADSYEFIIRIRGGVLVPAGPHRFMLKAAGSTELEVTVHAGLCGLSHEAVKTFAKVRAGAASDWNAYWQETGLIDFSGSQDPRAAELERRVILSQYLLKIQSAGSMPPAETGLTCNSWYGKFHLEMHFWHSAYLPLYHQGKLLRKSMRWYLEHLEEARRNAAANQFAGARWPKMVGCDGVDSPSPIAPLLIWQQPHVIYMLELIYQTEQDETLLPEYWEVVRETADFMADFAVYNESRDCYELLPPLIPVQESHSAEVSKNPAFELEYWREGLRIAGEWAGRIGTAAAPKWCQIAEKMAPLPEQDGIYLAHDDAPDTYINHAGDHPSMLMAYGLLGGSLSDRKTMENTLEQVLKTWDFDSAWGWDFAVMAMTAVRLGKPELAVDLLLKDTQKNQYTGNGHNRQGYRTDLPLYLPGNGSLLLAVAMMTAGYPGCKTDCPGFPAGTWKLQYENIEPLPY